MIVSPIATLPLAHGDFSKGPFTQAIFVAQLNAFFVALKVRFDRDFSAVCQCKTLVHVYFLTKSCAPAQK